MSVDWVMSFGKFYKISNPFPFLLSIKMLVIKGGSHTKASKKWERSGSVVECLTRDRRAAGSSLTGVTVLWSLSKTHLS